MKKSLLSVGAASMMLAMFATGCASTGADDAVKARKELNDFIVGSRAAEVIQKTNDKGIDAIADSSTIVYKRVGGAMRQYIEETRGAQAVIYMLYYMTDYPEETEAKYISVAQEFITGKDSVMTDIEKKEWTAEKLYKAAKDKKALQAYLDYQQGLKKAEDKVAYEKDNGGDAAAKAERAEGKKIYQATLAKEDWNAKIAEMKKLLDDVQKIGQNSAVLVQDIAQKITAKGNDVAALAQNPAMQKFVTETAPLVAKKTFANDARKKEIDAEIDAIAAKPEYKPIMDKKAQLGKEIDKLKADSLVLTDGVGTQIKFTGKAIPWLIEEYTNMMGMEE